MGNHVDRLLTHGGLPIKFVAVILADLEHPLVLLSYADFSCYILYCQIY